MPDLETLTLRDVALALDAELERRHPRPSALRPLVAALLAHGSVTPMSGAELREIRGRLGVSQARLAELLDHHQGSIGEMERGARPVPPELAMRARLISPGRR